MKKIDLITAVNRSSRFGLSDSKRAVEAVLEAMKDGLASDGQLHIRNWIGNFKLTNKRTLENARNPITGERVVVPARKLVRFKTSRLFRDSLNGGG